MNSSCYYSVYSIMQCLINNGSLPDRGQVSLVALLLLPKQQSRECLLPSQRAGESEEQSAPFVEHASSPTEP